MRTLTASAVSSCATSSPGTLTNIQTNGSGKYLDDMKLALQARNSDLHFEQLCVRFEPTIQAECSKYFLAGGDQDDLRQEALYGLYKAIWDYDGRQSSLASFVSLCVERQVITAVKTATRGKQQPLNQADSFSRPVGDEGLTLMEMLEDSASSVPQKIAEKERLRGLIRAIRTQLSSFEQQVLQLWVSGESYEEIAARLSCHLKAVDNALQRVRRKLTGFIALQEHSGTTQGLSLPSPASDAHNAGVSTHSVTPGFPIRRVSAMRSTPQIQALVQCLEKSGGACEDRESGKAVRKLAMALGKSPAATSQLVGRAVQQGIVETEVSNKRTYAIRLKTVGSAAAPSRSGSRRPPTQSKQNDSTEPQGRLDYAALGASLLQQATVAVNEHGTLTQRVADLEGELTRLQENNAWLEGEKTDLEQKLESAETDKVSLSKQAQELRTQLQARPESSLDDDAREGVDRALRLVS